jgi:protoporphyrinogen oxidase
VVVIGAGPAGLTAAYILSKDGYRVTVLEADKVVGGISRTVQHNGYRFDIGGHRFFTKIPQVQALWEELLGPEFIRVPRLSRIHYNGKYFDYPLKAASALAGVGLVNAIQIVWSYLGAALRPHAVEENFEQWVSNRFGRRMYEIFFKTYTEKIWGIPCSEIRAEWAAQRIQGLSLAKAIVSLTPLAGSTQTKSLIQEFSYPRLGPGQMWEAASDRILAMGNSVLLQHCVVAIELEADATSASRAVAVRASSPNGECSFHADHVISTMPIQSLVGALRPGAPATVREAAEGLRYRDFLLVALILDKDHLFPDNWIYIHTPSVKVGRIQNFNNWSRAMVPEPGRSCLGMEYFCFESDSLWKSSDADLLALASRELTQLGLAVDARIVDGAVVRMPKAYPIYDSRYRECLDRVREFIDPIVNLQTVGRNGMHKYNNQDHSMLTAMMAAENLQGRPRDVWSVNTDFEYHEEQRLDKLSKQAVRA